MISTFCFEASPSENPLKALIKSTFNAYKNSRVAYTKNVIVAITISKI